MTEIQILCRKIYCSLLLTHFGDFPPKNPFERYSEWLHFIKHIFVENTKQLCLIDLCLKNLKRVQFNKMCSDYYSGNWVSRLLMDVRTNMCCTAEWLNQLSEFSILQDNTRCLMYDMISGVGSTSSVNVSI